MNPIWIFVGVLMVLAGLYVGGVLDEVLAPYGLNAHDCVEYASGWVCK